jgi:hypothetical protein
MELLNKFQAAQSMAQEDAAVKIDSLHRKHQAETDRLTGQHALLVEFRSPRHINSIFVSRLIHYLHISMWLVCI